MIEHIGSQALPTIDTKRIVQSQLAQYTTNKDSNSPTSPKITLDRAKVPNTNHLLLVEG